MIVKILDQNGHVAGGVQVYENNFDGEVSIQDTYHVEIIEDNGRDDVFGTNEEQITVQVEPQLLRVAIAKDIVDDIVSQRKGQIYDPDEDLDYFVNSFLEAETERIRELVDEMMMNHLEDDNITVKED